MTPPLDHVPVIRQHRSCRWRFWLALAGCTALPVAYAALLLVLYLGSPR